jgi:hypothetical protein
MTKAQLLDLQTMRGVAILDWRISPQCPEQAALADLALSDEEQLRLVQRLALGRDSSEVGPEFVDARVGRGLEFRIQLVVVEVEPLEVGELGDLGGQGRQLVGAEDEPLEVGESCQRRGNSLAGVV